jgi:dUTP pyrophosphatase
MTSFQNNAVLRFVKPTENTRTLTRGSPWSAGLDLHSAYDVTVPARGKILVLTDLGIQLPTGYCGHVAPRSGPALHHHIDIGGGILDEDYRGDLDVILYNHSEIPFTVSRGDRIAQFICQKICNPILEEVVVLDLTKQGEEGFGSSGIN